jgi:asparagine synthase (glutamine-hydrolysing)
MCGITGAVWTDPDVAIDESTLLRMTNALHHRGPDDVGRMTCAQHHQPPFDSTPGVALGFRRLSIIDLEGGRQPISNEDGSVWAVFNGEIYNYKTIRRRLEGAGHTFKTECDSETIVHLYEDEGPSCFSALNGMFAIAIWDIKHRRLVLGRDRLGQKPLVYRLESNRLLFASELKSLLEAPNVPRDVDASAIDEFLTFQYVPHPNSIYRGINKLAPGRYAVYQGGKLDIKSYWTPNYRKEIAISQDEAAERLRELMRSAVEMRMQADVPLGAFLSGGVDSSLIVALMQEISTETVKTFSIGFAQPEYDESKYAQQVADALGTDHHAYQVTPNAIEVLPNLIEHYDEPFADSSAIPTWFVSQWARRQVTVSLSGDGGDELFVGYPRYRAVDLDRWCRRVPPFTWLMSSRLWDAIPASTRKRSLVRKLQRFSQGMRMSPSRRYLDWISIFNESRRAAVYSDEFVEQLPNSDPLDFLNQARAQTQGRDDLTRASLTDLHTYLPCDLMTKVDIASMANSLEVRQPFLDYRLVEFAASLPVSLKYRRGRGKRLLQDAFGDLLPNEIWNRPKMGFGVPIDHWFRNELKDMVRDILLDDTARQRGWFQMREIERLIDDHQSGRFDHAYRLWALLVLELWMRRWVTSPI